MLGAGAGRGPTGRRPAVLSTPAAQASAQAPCAAVLVNIAPLYASGADKTNFYALLLRSTDVQQRTVSGVLSLHTASARYDVSFSGAVAAGLTSTAVAPAIVVRFPEDVAIVRGLLTQINGNTCAPFTVLNPSAFAHFRPQPSDLAAAVADAPRIRARSRCRTGAAVRPRRGRDHRSARYPKYPASMGSAARKSRS